MARKQPQETTQEPSGIDLSELMTGDELSPALSQLFNELGVDASGKITVYVNKLDAATGKEPRVWQGVPDDYDLMAIARRFGSGDYRIKIYTPTDRGNPGQRANQVLPVLLDPAEDARIVQMRKGEIPATPNVQPAQSALTPETIVAAVVGAVKAAMPAPIDAFAMVDRVAGIMTKLNPPQTGGGMGTIKDALELAKTFAPLYAPREEVNPAAKPGEQALSRGISLVERMIAKHLEGNPNMQQSVQQAQPVQDGETTLTVEQQAELNKLRDALRFACTKADQKVDPAIFAQFIYDDLPDAMLAELGGNPQWFAVICANVPECGKHEAWFQTLRTELVKFAVEDGVLTPDGQLRIDDSHGALDSGNAAATSGEPTAAKPTA